MNLKNYSIIAVIGIIFFFCSVGITSAIMMEATVPELVSESSAIITGTVTNIHTEWDADHLNINTIHTVHVNSSLKGGVISGSEIKIITLGGVLDGMSEWVEDQPNFYIGEEVGLLLSKKFDNLIESSDNKYWITDNFQGVFPLTTATSGISSESEGNYSREDFSEMIEAGKQEKILQK